MEEKIDDLEYTLDNIDTTITILSKYKEFNKEVADLKIYKSALELDLDNLKEEYEELCELDRKEAEKEIMALEMQYYREVM